jgi:hypothetical protein
MDIVIENMTEVWGHGWWDATPWRFVSPDGAHIGEPHETRAEAEADLAQYLERLKEAP